ncbi:MAG: glycosyltransferase family 2 protein [Candidatus Scalindua sp.]
MTISVIICTRNRLNDTIRCLASIAIQTQLPDEVLIIDSSDEECLFLLLKQPRFETLSIQYKHTKPGLTMQRNIGIELAKGDIIFFFDDDVELGIEYIEKVLEVYENDSLSNVGGVQGIDLNQKKTFLEGKKRLLFYRLFFLGRSDTYSKLLPSGGVTHLDVASPKIRYSKKPIRINCQSGCIMSFHRKVFEKFRFDENYIGYSHGEDVDFSHRVSKKYLMYFTSFAEAYHNQPSDKKEWYGTEHFVRSSIKAQVFLFRKHLRNNVLNYYVILWSWLGLLIWDGIIHPNKVHFFGEIRAMRKEFFNVFRSINS